MQGLTAGVLHHQVDVLWAVYALMEFHYVWVVQAGEDLDLADGLLLALQIQELVTIILLDGYALPCLQVDTFFDLGVSTTANELAKAVLLYPRAVWGTKLTICVIVLLMTKNILSFGLFREKFILGSTHRFDLILRLLILDHSLSKRIGILSQGSLFICNVTVFSVKVI